MQPATEPNYIFVGLSFGDKLFGQDSCW